MIHFKYRCIGFTIRKTRARIMELWFCFSGVKPHSHPGQAIEVIPIFGKADFARVNPHSEDTEKATLSDDEHHLRSFTIPAGWVHWFETRFLVVLTISDKPVPATKNYVE